MLSYPDPLMSWQGAAGILFDLDGVLTPTAAIHEQAWKGLFDHLLKQHPNTDAYTEADYFEYIDGKPRIDGVTDFIASRSLALPEGTMSDPPGLGTLHALGNYKDAIFRELVGAGVTPFAGSVRFLTAAMQMGKKVAVVSSSRNALSVLESAGLSERFSVVVDGLVAERAKLAGKPSPATYEFAAAHLNLETASCVVVEDAVSGVRAGRAGTFHSVIGVDRGAGREALLDAGADIVVGDLGELCRGAGPGARFLTRQIARAPLTYAELISASNLL